MDTQLAREVLDHIRMNPEGHDQRDYASLKPASWLLTASAS
jgi:hypothetical protein